MRKMPFFPLDNGEKKFALKELLETDHSGQLHSH